jgi:hypothetical protein
MIRCAKEFGEDSVRPTCIGGRSRPASARYVGIFCTASLHVIVGRSANRCHVKVAFGVATLYQKLTRFRYLLWSCELVDRLEQSRRSTSIPHVVRSYYRILVLAADNRPTLGSRFLLRPLLQHPRRAIARALEVWRTFL